MVSNEPANLGMVTPAIMPMITNTMIISIRVKPVGFCKDNRGLRFTGNLHS